jgi:hypothetical protein
MIRKIVVAALSSSTGLPLAGAAPAWALLVDARTGVAVTPTAITELGLGLYQTMIDDNSFGVLSFGNAAQTQFLFLPSVNVPSFGSVDQGGAPTSTTPGWYSSGGVTACYDTSTGISVASPPAIVKLTNGLFTIPTLGPTMAGFVDCGAAAAVRYIPIGLPDGANSIAPVVGNIRPAAGTSITPSESLGFDVTDTDNALAAVAIGASFAGSLTTELIYDGTTFQPLYAANSTRTAIANGLRFSLVRAGGWPGTPTITPLVLDAAGNENA